MNSGLERKKWDYALTLLDQKLLRGIGGVSVSVRSLYPSQKIGVKALNKSEVILSQ